MLSKAVPFIGTVTLLILTLLNVRNLFPWQYLLRSFMKENNLIFTLCNKTLACDCTNFTVPYIAPGPSEIQKIVPMSVLKDTLKNDSIEGLKFLDHVSLSRYSQCKPKKATKAQTYKGKISWCKGRGFARSNRPLVALTSFHGSGNTWLRYLLEQATGIFTGSIYCDEHLKVSFPGELVVSGNVVAIKTHHADSRALPKDVQLELKKELYDKAIVLIRNPFDALLSEANRRWNSKGGLNDHVGLADEAKFIGNANWDWYVEYKGASWAYFIHTWLAQNDTPILLVQYENLVSNLEKELRRILEFLNLTPHHETMECVLRERQGRYRRNRHLNFNPYSRENLDNINRYIKPALPLLLKYNISYNLR